MAKEHDKKESERLPASVTDFIRQLLKKMRYRRKVRKEVKAELAAHFEDELRGCADDGQKDERAKQLIAEFGDPKLLGVLMRRAKKRCRPLWQKVLLRSLQAFGIFVLYLVVCLIPLCVGKPTLRIDYVEWLNGLVRNGRDEADNARPYYEEACKLSVKMPLWLAESMSPWPTDFNDVELKLLSDWLEENRQAVEMLREGSGFAGYWSKYRRDKALSDLALVLNAWEIVASYHELARVMRWQIRCEAYAGNAEAALGDCVGLINFARHLQGHGLLSEQLVGTGVERLAKGEIFMLLDHIDVPASMLRDTHQQLEELFGTQGPVISLEAEKVYWYDAIQWGFTDNGQGNGHLLVIGLSHVASGDLKDNLWRLISFSYPDRKQMVTRIDQYFAEFADVLSKTPWELHSEITGEQVPKAQLQKAPLLMEIVISAYKRVNKIVWRLKTGREALLTVLAAKRYEKAKGRYPTDLDALIEAGYLKRLPMDPFSGQTLVYRKMADSFILYSVGPNFKDDRGISGTGSSGRANQWTDNGDTVFWPLPADQAKSQQ